MFDQMDVDGSGTLDQSEVELLAATAGKRMTKRQLHDAMVAMDTDGSGEVEFDEFTNWWINGVMHPPKGSSVFRMLSDKLEGKCKNVRYAETDRRELSSFCKFVCRLFASPFLVFCVTWSFVRCVHKRPGGFSWLCFCGPRLGQAFDESFRG